MIELTEDNLKESIKQVESMIRKIEAIATENMRQSQKTLIERRLTALKISLDLLNEKLLSYMNNV